MTYDQLESLAGRLSATIVLIARPLDDVHVIMDIMRREGRQELSVNEWGRLKPILELVKAVVGEDAAKQAIKERKEREAEMTFVKKYEIGEEKDD